MKIPNGYAEATIDLDQLPVKHSGEDPEFLRRLASLILDVADAGAGVYGIGGGARSYALQLRQHKAEPRRFVHPDVSLHVPCTPGGRALAADLVRLNPAGGRHLAPVAGVLQQLAPRHGLAFKIRADPWHVSPVEVPAQRARAALYDLDRYELPGDAEPPPPPPPPPATADPSGTLPGEGWEPPRWRFEGLPARLPLYLDETTGVALYDGKPAPRPFNLTGYLQHVLGAYAYMQGNGAFSAGVPDGYFGPKTRNALVWFQGAHQLVHDGIAGPKTWAVVDGIASYLRSVTP